MKKIIQILIIAILLLSLFLVIIFLFNPFNLRTKIIGGVINAYLSSSIQDYESLKKESINEKDAGVKVPTVNKNPLLTEDQEKALESYGVDVSKLPTEITSGMQDCFYEKVGKQRGDELIGGASPTPLEIIKIQSCLGK